jgi:hypothetical protein
MRIWSLVRMTGLALAVCGWGPAGGVDEMHRGGSTSWVGWSGTYSLPVGSDPVDVDVQLGARSALVALGPGHASLQQVVLSRSGGDLTFRVPGAPGPLTFVVLPRSSAAGIERVRPVALPEAPANPYAVDLGRLGPEPAHVPRRSGSAEAPRAWTSHVQLARVSHRESRAAPDETGLNSEGDESPGLAPRLFDEMLNWLKSQGDAKGATSRKGHVSPRPCGEILVAGKSATG